MRRRSPSWRHSIDQTLLAATAVTILFTNLAGYAGQTEAPSAIQRAKRILEIQEKELGPQHPKTADNLIDLAWLYRVEGEHSKAELLYQRALKIREKILGPEHPDTASNPGSVAPILMPEISNGKSFTGDRFRHEAEKIIGVNETRTTISITLKPQESLTAR